MFLSFVAQLESLSECIWFSNPRTSSQRRHLQSLRSPLAWLGVILLYPQHFRASSSCKLNWDISHLTAKSTLPLSKQSFGERCLGGCMRGICPIGKQTDQNIFYSSGAEAQSFWMNMCLTIYNWPLHKRTWNFYSLKPHLLTLLECKILLFAINLYQDKQYIC